MAFGSTEEPILSRLDRIDNILRKLEEMRTGSNRTPKSSCASTPTSGTLTSEGHPSSNFSPKSLEKHCRPIDDVILETETKGTMIERLCYVEGKVLKVCMQLEAELEAEKRRSEEEKTTATTIPTSSPRRKSRGLKQLMKSCVRGQHEKVWRP